MWAAGATQMIVRVTGSTLFSNPNLTSILTYDHRSYAASSQQTSGNQVGGSDVVERLRALRARSPFALFVKDNYSETSKKFPDLKMTDISKKMSEAWKNLSTKEKEAYIKLSNDQRTIYEEEKNRLSPIDLQKIAADEKSKTIARQVKKNLDQLKIRKPRSAFTHFVQTLDRGNADIKDFMRGAAQRWAHLPEQEKQKFRDLYKEDKRQYSEDLAKWAMANRNVEKPQTRRASPSDSSKKKEDEVKKRSKSKDPAKPKPAAKAAVKEAPKSPAKKTTKKSSNEEKSSSEDEAPSKTKRPTKTTDAK